MKGCGVRGCPSGAPGTPLYFGLICFKSELVVNKPQSGTLDPAVVPQMRTFLTYSAAICLPVIQNCPPPNHLSCLTLVSVTKHKLILFVSEFV